MSATLVSARPGPSAFAMLSDDEVVHRVRNGEPALFEILMRRYNPRLYRVARSILRDEHEAEDVMQQSYVNAFAHLDQFAERSTFATWLTRIATYEALGRLRRRRRLKEVAVMDEDDRDPLDTMTAPGPDPERQAFAGELHRALEQALDALPESYRCVFVLRDVEGLTTGEAAECLGLSLDVVKTRLHRARSTLRRELWSRAGIAVRDVYSFHASRCDRVVAHVFAELGISAIQ
jgi:RNA polymerase sigma-70 factor, ECF subfamily